MKFIYNTPLKLIILSLCLLTACKKLVTIPPPVTNIINTVVFSRDDQANSAVAGIYYQMLYGNNGPSFCTGGITIASGLSADELNAFSPTLDYAELQNNTLQSNNGVITGLWNSAYQSIYNANAVIAGLSQSTSGALHDSAKNILTGEAKFIRAFCYFYLTYLWDNAPLVLTTNWHNTASLNVSSNSQVTQQIIADLQDAQNLMLSDYSVSSGERVRPNRWAATALLARLYLYLGRWSDAEAQATSIINNTTYKLVPNPNNVFLANSQEAIWQLKQNNATTPFNATIEGDKLIPFSNTSQPNYTLTNQLLSTFDSGDLRRTDWVDSTNSFGNIYYYPYKYKTGPSMETPTATITEYYMMLRLGEQYLIRAEARAQQGESNAVDDLTMIRNRAGLSSYSGSTNKDSLLAAIYHERQVELFAEWGHRWLDLKRIGQSQTILASIPNKQPFNNYQLAYPIPVSETVNDPNLKQNIGYY